MTNHQTARAKLPILPQLCKVIPSHLTANLAKNHGINPRVTNRAANRVKKQNRQPSRQSAILTVSPTAIQAAMG